MILAEELRAHLVRLGGWAAISTAAGAFLLVRDQTNGAGVMTLIWAFVNGGIVLASWRGASSPMLERFRRFLVFNIALNVVWIAIGVAMWRGREEWVRSAGAAMILQAVVLMGLDLFLFFRTRGAEPVA